MAILICLLTLLPSGAKAQMGFDVTSVEAYIFHCCTYLYDVLPRNMPFVTRAPTCSNLAV